MYAHYLAYIYPFLGFIFLNWASKTKVYFYCFYMEGGNSPFPSMYSTLKSRGRMRAFNSVTNIYSIKFKKQITKLHKNSVFILFRLKFWNQLPKTCKKFVFDFWKRGFPNTNYNLKEIKWTLSYCTLLS